MSTDADAPPFADMVSIILRKTNDGNDLTPQDLRLCEFIINAGPSEVSELAECDLIKLYQNAIRRGGYKKPWYHGIEHMTQDTEGYIYWKGVSVEHYSFRDYQEADKAARKLERDCKALESAGVKVTGSSLMRLWREARAQ